MVGAGSGHSTMGIATFVLSSFPALVFAGAYLLVLEALSKQPSGADQTGYAFGMFLLLVLTVASEVVALGLDSGGAPAIAQEDVRVRRGSVQRAGIGVGSGGGRVRGPGVFDRGFRRGPAKG